MKPKVKISKFQIPCSKCGFPLFDCACVKRVIVKSKEQIQKEIKERKTIPLGKYYSEEDLIKAMWYAWQYGTPYRPADKTYREMIQPDFDKWIKENLK